MSFSRQSYYFNKVLFLIVSLLSSFCASNQMDTMYYAGITDNDDMSLERYKKNSEGIVSDYKGWNTILVETFRKLAPESKVSIFILKKNSFNMVFIPENYFLIHTDTLDILDKELPNLKTDITSLKNCSDKNSCRELMIAPIIAHELAHYFQEDHVKLKLKMAEYGSMPEKEKSDKILVFKREREFAADTFAASLLASHHYDSELSILPIKILKQINQDRNKNPNERIDYYLKSHPSPNERLSNLIGNETYRNLEELEKAFHLIATATNKNTLKYAISLIENQLKNFPDNIELKRARVTAMHRYWMYTATPAELKFVAVIDQPLFSDSEEFNRKKGTNKIPGDEKIYKETLSLYIELYEKLNGIDFGFISNYSVLLAYSDREDNKKKSLELAMYAFQNSKTFKTLNNLGIVYGLNNQLVIGIKSFWAEIPSSDKKNIDESLPKNTVNANSKEDISFQLEGVFTADDRHIKEKERIISLINFTLSKFYSDNKEDNVDANKLRKKFFYAGDSPSPWVEYLNNEIAHNK